MVYKGLWSLYTIVVTLVGLIIGHFGGLALVASRLFTEATVPDEALTIYSRVGMYLAGILAGFLVSQITFRRLVELITSLERVPLLEKIVVMAGVILGLLFGLLVAWPFHLLPQFGVPIQLLACVVGVILGVAVARSALNQLARIFPSLSHPEGGPMPGLTAERGKFLDTNIIIDGRIADICKTGFLEGPLLVPGFVLRELQTIADSADNLRRARGRRGLDVLNRMRKELDQTVEILEDEEAPYDGQESVDLRLVKLARARNGVVVTNDYNLNKVAELHGVPVLNVNELANAIKPVFLPGEELRVMPVKEGSQPRQGVGYLDDGTMVVVQNASDRLGQEFEVVVTSLHQTVAGKMIFAEPKDEASRPAPAQRERNAK